MRLAELPVANYSKSGYERLWVLPKFWPAWRESDGRCYALAFDNRIGGEWSPDVVVTKEEIPESVFNGHNQWSDREPK